MGMNFFVRLKVDGLNVVSVFGLCIMFGVEMFSMCICWLYCSFLVVIGLVVLWLMM